MVRKKIHYFLCYSVSGLTVNFVVIRAIFFPEHGFIYNPYSVTRSVVYIVVVIIT